MTEDDPLFLERLRELLLRRDDPAAWQVFADFLLAHGVVRGELMALHDLRNDPRRASLLREHRALWLGRDALLGDLQLTWHRGFIQHAVFPNTGVHVDCARELATHPSGALLDSVEAGPEHVAGYLERDGTPVRHLTIRATSVQNSQLDYLGWRAVRGWERADEADARAARLSAAWQRRAPHLKSLTLADPITADLADFAHPTVEVLSFSGSLAGLEDVLLRCPAVQTLQLPNMGAWGTNSGCRGALFVSALRRIDTVELGIVDGTVLATLERSQLKIGTIDLSQLDPRVVTPELRARFKRHAKRVRVAR